MQGSSPPTTTFQYPDRDLAQAIEARSIPALQSAVRRARARTTPEAHAEYLHRALWLAASEGALPLVQYLLADAGATVRSLRVAHIANAASVPLLTLLRAHGWDVDQADARAPPSQGRRLLDYAVGAADDAMVAWLLARGARADGADVAYAEQGHAFPCPPPLLETCAKRGHVSMFRTLRARGAELGTRTLQQAAWAAAAVGADPAAAADGKDGGGTGRHDRYGCDEAADESVRRTRAEMLRFLVEEVGLDVNGVDTRRESLAYHYGTPINYAARCPKGAAVVKWLLEKGADPHVKCSAHDEDATELAKREKCDKVVAVLEKWIDDHGKKNS
ncbi:hypothetical protein F5Y15DRAFT_416564 [Xylariaceae sp. FL0016]|nr:hypothetical protein F5Y15DRAFT_416564 [Xylariaceae sp. FL0016]